MTVIDMHTHMITDAWVEQLRAHGAPDYAIGRRADGIEALIENGSMTMPLIPPMFDLDIRIKDMDAAGIDLAVLSLTSPNVYWGDARASADAARTINDGMAAAQRAHPDRLRYIASLPWEYPELATEELARACDAGAVGVMVLANIRGAALTEARFAPVWQEIDRRALPVFIHPTNPPGADAMDLGPLRLLPTVGFTFDTSLAVGRMVLDGFLDRFPNLKIIAAHGGGTLPFLASRFDLFFAHSAPDQKRISDPPSSYFRRIYYDAVMYDPASLAQCIDVGGAEHVLFGTDYPHATDVPGLMGQIRDLPDGSSRALLGDNAARLFNL